MPRIQAHSNADELLSLLDADEERQKRAIPLAYQHEKPTVSRTVALYGLMAAIIAVAAVLGLVVRP